MLQVRIFRATPHGMLSRALVDCPNDEAVFWEPLWLRHKSHRKINITLGTLNMDNIMNGIKKIGIFTEHNFMGNITDNRIADVHFSNE